MTTSAVLATLSIALRLAATLWPLWVYRRVPDRRLLGLSLAGAALLVVGLVERAGDPLSLGISVLTLGLVVVTGTVMESRLTALQRIRDSEALNRHTLESVTEAVFITDDEGVLTQVWPHLTDFFGLPEGAVQVGDHVRELLGSVAIDRKKLDESGAITNIEVVLATEGRGVLRLLVDVKRVQIQGGTMLFTCRDVTDFVTVESTLERTLAELRELKDRFEAEALYLKEELRAEHNIEGIVGSSPRLQQMLDAVQTVAATESTVLIRGETGSGKELVARALHELSPRRDRPLVRVNCAALPPNLVESELFGHERGAFTGAVGRKVGRFELANGGTLFLDEIGELPLDLQPKLLRVLQEGEFERVGGTQTLHVDVRLLAATNRDLQHEAAAGRFRSDLYYRLAVFPIEVPPLRERTEDLLMLASHFLAESATKLGREFTGFTGPSLAAMQAYSWPGNVREMRNVVERAAILSPGGSVDLVPMLREEHREEAGPLPPTTGLRLADVERAHIVAVLDRTGWAIEGAGAAAELLDLRPSTLRSRMKKLGIRRR